MLYNKKRGGTYYVTTKNSSHQAVQVGCYQLSQRAPWSYTGWMCKEPGYRFQHPCTLGSQLRDNDGDIPVIGSGAITLRKKKNHRMVLYTLTALWTCTPGKSLPGLLRTLWKYLLLSKQSTRQKLVVILIYHLLSIQIVAASMFQMRGVKPQKRCHEAILIVVILTIMPASSLSIP